MKIYKYTLRITDGPQTIEMPAGAIVLSCQQQNTPFLSVWAIVNPEAVAENRTFEVIGTGMEIPNTPREYVATVVAGLYVWHIFEINTPTTIKELAGYE